MRLRGIDTNLIVALHALLMQRNVTRAAKQVGLSQSSMSHALARLRAHFHDPLLTPAGRRLVLTEHAEALVGPVGDAVAQLERVFAPREPFEPASSRRSFRIATTDNLALYVLPKLVARLQQHAPGIDLRVSALPADWPEALQRGDIDLKLGRKTALLGALEQQELSREHFACVVRRTHPVRARPRVHEYAALDHLLVTTSARPAASSSIDLLLASQGLTRRVALTVPHFLVAPFVVASSDLVLTAPARLLEPFVHALSLRRIPLPLEVQGYALTQVWAARARDDEAHRWLREQIACVLR